MSKTIEKKSDFIAYIFIALAIAAGAWIRVDNLELGGMDPEIRTPDEAIYMAYASVVAHERVQGIQVAVREYNANPKLWILPPPTRVGYLYTLAVVMKLTGRYDLDAGILLSLAASILTLVVAAALCLRFMSPWIALYACTFISTSPMELAIARKGWQDGVMTLTGGLLVYLCAEILQQKNKFLPIVLFGFAGLYGMLVKESGVLFFGICVLSLIFWLIKQRAWGIVAGLLCATVLALAAWAGILIRLSGGWHPLIELYGHLREAVAVNEHAVQMQNGPWLSNVFGLLLVSPATTFLCFTGIVAAFLKRPLARNDSPLFLALIFTSFFILGSLPDYYKNLRYISPVYIPLFALAGHGMLFVQAWLRKVTPNRAAARLTIGGMILVIAALDLANFDAVFRQGHVKDLVNPLLMEHSIYLFR
jgi:4-amino-4-deoxy-L-arabinose transferase-like glycosyltransferase